MAYNPYQQYKKTTIQTASQGKLILMMYDGAIRFLNIALENIPNRKYDVVNNHLIKSQDIITELLLALKLDTGDIAKNLYSLYEYMNRRLVEANIKKNEDIIKEVIGLLNELREAWSQVIDTVNKQVKTPVPSPKSLDKDLGTGINISG